MARYFITNAGFVGQEDRIPKQPTIDWETFFAPFVKKSVIDEYETALDKNAAVFRGLESLSRETAQQITGGYLDIADDIEISDAHKEELAEFSKKANKSYERLMEDLKGLKMRDPKDRRATNSYLKKADEAANMGYKNEYSLAALLSQYEGVDVYFPHYRTAEGGSPKVDLFVSVKGKMHPISLKAPNGTQIEAHITRETASSIIPGEGVVKKLEETANRIFYFRPKYQAYGRRPGQPDRLRRDMKGDPKLAGVSVRMEYFDGSKSEGKPTLPDSVALEAFAGVRQNSPIDFYDYKGEKVGTAKSSSARVLLVGGFTEFSKMIDEPKPREIFKNAIPLSNKGIRKANLKVSLRMSGMGDRTSDWITTKEHITDHKDLDAEKYLKILESRI